MCSRTVKVWFRHSNILIRQSKILVRFKVSRTLSVCTSLIHTGCLWHCFYFHTCALPYPLNCSAPPWELPPPQNKSTHYSVTTGRYNHPLYHIVAIVVAHVRIINKVFCVLDCCVNYFVFCTSVELNHSASPWELLQPQHKSARYSVTTGCIQTHPVLHRCYSHSACMDY